MILTPNGLQVLDRLGVLARIKDRCFIHQYRTFKNAKDETVRKTLVADPERYGYTNHRIWRATLLDEMRKMLAERSVHVSFDSKFNGIVSDTSDRVKFEINSETHHASLLIGSDGIYSAVRKHLAPDIIPEYTGIIGILAHVKRDSVSWPYADYEANATIQDKPGAIFWIPEDPKAEDIMIGRQVQYPEQSRDDLERLQADQDRLLSFYDKDYDEWGPTARSIIDQVRANKETLFCWPYLRMPKLPQWYSDTGRVILVGDGAHALPPSSGQGINQALEDAYSLTVLLTLSHEKIREVNGDAKGEHSKDEKMLEAMSRWQEMRQQRIDAVFDWATNVNNVSRLPEAERKKLIAEGKVKESKAGEGDDMSWLYQPNLEQEVKTWLSGVA